MSDYTFSADATPLPARRKDVGSRVLTATLAPGVVGTGAYSWSDNRREQVRHFRLWTYVAVRAIMEECARHAPHVGYCRTRDRKPGYRQKAWAEARHRKTMSAVRPHEDVEPAEPDHPLLQLFERPNAWDSAGVADLIQEWVLFESLTGNGYFWQVPNLLTGLPRELWVLPSHWVYRVGDRNRPDGVRGYEVRPYVGAGQFVVAPDEIIHTARKNPLHKIDGYSPLRAIDNWTDEDESAHRARFWYFRNLWGISGAVELPEDYHDASDQDLDRIYAKLDARFRGESNYGRPAILGPGMKYTPLKITAGESDFYNTAEQLRDMILSAWGVPKEVVGVQPSGGDLSWYAPLQQFCRNVVAPILSRLGHVLTRRLARLYDPSLRVWWDDPTPDNPEQVNRDLQLDLSNGVRTLNEARAVRGLEASREPNADKLMVPSGLTPIDKAGQGAAPQRHEVNFGGGAPGAGGPPAPPKPKGKRHRPRRRKALDAQGGEGPAVRRADLKAADFITYPKDVPGSNCGSCRHNDAGVCGFEGEINGTPVDLRGQPVNDRNCCMAWDADGTLRDWQKAGRPALRRALALAPSANGHAGGNGVAKAEFNESDHPRASDGRFGDKPGEHGHAGARPAHWHNLKPGTRVERPRPGGGVESGTVAGTHPETNRVRVEWDSGDVSTVDAPGLRPESGERPAAGPKPKPPEEVYKPVRFLVSFPNGRGTSVAGENEFHFDADRAEEALALARRLRDEGRDVSVSRRDEGEWAPPGRRKPRPVGRWTDVPLDGPAPKRYHFGHTKNVTDDAGHEHDSGTGRFVGDGGGGKPAAKPAKAPWGEGRGLEGQPAEARQEAVYNVLDMMATVGLSDRETLQPPADDPDFQEPRRLEVEHAVGDALVRLAARQGETVVPSYGYDADGQPMTVFWGAGGGSAVRSLRLVYDGAWEGEGDAYRLEGERSVRVTPGMPAEQVAYLALRALGRGVPRELRERYGKGAAG